MKQHLIILLAAALTCSGCGSGRALSGDPGAVLAGASIGGNVGGALGGLIGESSHNWRGGYRGSAIGTIIGTLAGAAIGNAITTPKAPEEGSYAIERTEPYPMTSEPNRTDEAIGRLRIRNIRIIDEGHNQTLNSNEHCKIIFEIMNEGRKSAFNVVPVVVETTGMKRIHLSSSVMIECIAPHEGLKYTANLYAGKRMKNDEACIRIAIADEYGNEYDWQEFTLPTQR